MAALPGLLTPPTWMDALRLDPDAGRRQPAASMRRGMAPDLPRGPFSFGKEEVIECFKLSSINLNYESDRFVGLIGDQVLERPLCFRSVDGCVLCRVPPREATPV